MRAQECGSKEKYLMTIFQSEPNCHSGVHGALTWTPDENTPDVVYYQVSSYNINLIMKLNKLYLDHFENKNT